MTGTTTPLVGRSRRALRTALVGALTLAPFVAAGTVLVPATAAPPNAAELAAGYLEDRLVDGGHVLSQEFDGMTYPDYGVTADAVLAMDAAGTGQDEAALATAYLQEHRLDYTGFGDESEIAAGAVAKLLNVAVAQGEDPTDFGGMDLVATLQGLEDADGRYSDQSAWGNYSNVFGQSLAIGGLARAGSAPSTAAVGFLRAQQCDDGGFRVFVDAATCASDPDATALAVQALIRVAGAADADVQEGLDYLAVQQDDATGAVGGSGPTAAVNANSTGLAGQAFLAGGRSAQARLAQAYVASLQYGCEFPPALRGGIAYDRATYDLRLSEGASALPSDQDNRSTAQASLALAGTPLFVVTADGAAAVAPETDCAATTTTTAPSTTTTTSATSSTTTSATTTAAPSTTASAPTSTSGAVLTSGGSVLDDGVVAAPVRDGDRGDVRGGALARTGSDVAPFVGTAVALVLLGAVLVAVRRSPRGRHQ